MIPVSRRIVAGFGCVVVLLLWSAVSVPAAPPQGELERGLQAFRRGAFDEAVSHFTEAARRYEASGQQTERITALAHLARAYVSLGQYRESVKSLEIVLAVAERVGDRVRAASALAALGTAQAVIGPAAPAEQYLRRALAIARETRTPRLIATTLNDLGNILAAQKKSGEALAAYRESAALAQQLDERTLAARAAVNAAATARESGDPASARVLLDAAHADARRAPASQETGLTLVTIGLGFRELRGAAAVGNETLMLRAAEVLTEAGTMADRLGDRRTASYAWGYLGGLYEDEGRHPEALRLTRQAIFEAQRVGAGESLYRWQWQAGRLLRKEGALDDALAGYRRAVRTLQAIRPEIIATAGPFASFRESVGPVYFELVDLLLKQADGQPTGAKATSYLIEAREVVELLKVAELRDYFRDDCVDTALAKLTKLDVVSPTAAVIYPILLSDRTELLVTLPSGLKRITVPVGADVVTQEVREFRRRLEKRTTRQYLLHAQQLYNWLIRPLEADLTAARIDTLIFVPDGPLRTIPMAALHDGARFLVTKYALGITPGLNLTDPRPLPREGAKVLAVGVTESVQGFPPLPEVAAELEAVRAVFGGSTLLDRDFLMAALERKLKEEQFSIVHIASHGEFGNDVNGTFVLTFDDKLTIDRLDQLVGVFRFRDEPLELITLSACDTAEGDDRAALGLAGVAVKAGARSAVATLWQINDQASSELIREFYRELRNPDVSRASALQRAQVKILSDPRYEHPGFWSPFLLINNWL
jgi:CHAT domain-containing protein